MGRLVAFCPNGFFTMPMEPTLTPDRYTSRTGLREGDVHLAMAGLVVAILIATVAWTFAEPYVAHWRGIRAAEKRRIAERRRPTPQ